MKTKTEITTSGISGKLTVAEASVRLGVSRHQVRELINNSTLRATRTAGDAFLIDALSLEKLRLAKRSNGRPWNQSSAWATLWLLSGLKVDWLSYHQLRRLKISLAEITPDELVWMSRKRTESIPVRISESFMDKAKQLLVPTGMSASSISSFGLSGSVTMLAGYISTRDYELFVKIVHAVEGDNPNLEVLVSDWLPFGNQKFKDIPDAVIATDLAVSLDTRERVAGLKKLKELLNGFNNNQ
jgi:excisionase family DNA binding protein